MDFDQLNMFVQVARLNSFSRAAIKCFRTQPAISAQIRLLEEEVGARLFDRGGGKVGLTPAGRLFLNYVERMQLLRKEALDAVADQQHTPRGELSLAANEGSCLHVLPEVFAAFKRQHPDVQLRVRRGEHQEILEAVLEHRVDFGVLSLPVHEPRIKVVPLHRDEIFAIVAPGHPLAAAAEKARAAAVAGDGESPRGDGRARGPGSEKAPRGAPESPLELPLELIVTHPLLLPKAGNTRDALDGLLEPYSAQVRISMELDSTEMIKSFSAAGLGVGFVGRAMAQAEARAGELALLAWTGRKLYRELGLVFRRDRALGRAALAFIDLAIEESKRSPAAPTP